MANKGFVDLFAGCGGLSLGLEKAGFEPVFVSELHPDAMETYLHNRIGLPVAEGRNQLFDILGLTSNPEELDALAKRLKREHGEIQLVVGGPPCQGYSGIGHRRSFVVAKEDIPSNHLYREMAKVVQSVGPRAFIFENVKGLLNSKWTPAGRNGEIWNDVQASFERIEVKSGRRRLSYRIEPRLLHAKNFGVPQNRPRIIMIGIREDISLPASAEMFPDGGKSAPDLIDLLGDLVDTNWKPGGETPTYPSQARTKIQRIMRTNRDGTMIGRKGDFVSDHEYGKHSDRVMEKFQYMIDHDGEIPPSMTTKKFAQRLLPKVWGEKGPTLTATSLPDDYVHFSQPRVPTVREWARLQTFPDWYQFRGKRTTGGRRRAGDPDAGDWSRDVPKFTQIGNAVPVLLAQELGNHLSDILDL